jgi:putative sterol carrier protein
VAARQFFESLEARVDPSRLAGINQSYLFDIDGAGRWLVDIRDGKLSVSEGGERADVTIRATRETFERVVEGRQSATTAYMTGKIKVDGDLGAALKLQKLF